MNYTKAQSSHAKKKFRYQPRTREQMEAQLAKPPAWMVHRDAVRAARAAKAMAETNEKAGKAVDHG